MGAQGNRGFQKMATLETAWHKDTWLDMERQKYEAQREVLLGDVKNLQYYLRHFARLLEFVPDATGQVAKIHAQMLQVHADSVARM